MPSRRRARGDRLAGPRSACSAARARTGSPCRGRSPGTAPRSPRRRGPARPPGTAGLPRADTTRALWDGWHPRPEFWTSGVLGVTDRSLTARPPHFSLPYVEGGVRGRCTRAPGFDDARLSGAGVELAPAPCEARPPIRARTSEPAHFGDPTGTVSCGVGVGLLTCLATTTEAVHHRCRRAAQGREAKAIVVR